MSDKAKEQADKYYVFIKHLLLPCWFITKEFDTVEKANEFIEQNSGRCKLMRGKFIQHTNSELLDEKATAEIFEKHAAKSEGEAQQ